MRHAADDDSRGGDAESGRHDRHAGDATATADAGTAGVSRRGQSGSQRQAQVWPSFLPNGRDFLYAQAANDPSHQGIFLGWLNSIR